MEKTTIEKYKDRGLTGLTNVGNTCYLNSCVQILSHTYELNEFLDEETYKTKLNKKPDSVLIIEWDKLRKLMWSQNCTIAPWGFVKAVQKISGMKGISLFTGYSQNDIQEFLMFLIDSFHNSISREVDMTISGTAKNDKDILAKACYKMMSDMYKNDYSDIVKIFCGISVTEILSVTDGERLSVRPEPFFVLSLSMPTGNKKLTLLECIDAYCGKERMEGDNAWYNEKTDKKQDIDKGIVFWAFPEVLVVHFKRWDYRGRKDSRLVTCDFENINLSKYVKGYNKMSNIFDLYGVCNHSGGAGGGHYTANVRVANGEWYNFNDTNVTKISDSQVLSPQAYCLFFRKKK